jgi:hypothetical protein
MNNEMRASICLVKLPMVLYEILVQLSVSGGMNNSPRRRSIRSIPAAAPVTAGSSGQWGTPGRAGVWTVAAGSGKRREIAAGGDAGARAGEGNELKCPSRQPPERDIGRASVRRAKLEIPSAAKIFSGAYNYFYGFGMYTGTDPCRFFAQNHKLTIIF